MEIILIWSLACCWYEFLRRPSWESSRCIFNLVFNDQLLHILSIRVREECEQQVKKYPNAKYKKFKTEIEARAFVEEGDNSYQSESHLIPASSNKSEKKVVRNSSVNLFYLFLLFSH